jgi:hypothetical protein
VVVLSQFDFYFISFVRFFLLVFVFVFFSTRVCLTCMMCMYLFVYSGFQYISCCVFCFVCLRRVYPMFPVSLDCPCLVSLIFTLFRLFAFFCLFLFLYFFLHVILGTPALQNRNVKCILSYK